MERLSWIIQVWFKGNYTCPYEKRGREIFDTDTSEGNLNREAEIG